MLLTNWATMLHPAEKLTPGTVCAPYDGVAAMIVQTIVSDTKVTVVWMRLWVSPRCMYDQNEAFWTIEYSRTYQFDDINVWFVPE